MSVAFTKSRRSDAQARPVRITEATRVEWVAKPSGTGSIALVLLALVATLFAVRTAAAFLIPLFISMILSYALSSAVSRLEQWGMPRPIGAALVMASLLALTTAGIHRVGADAEALLEQMPAAVEKVRLAIAASQRAAPGPLEHMKRTATELDKLAGTAAAPVSSAPAPAPPAIDMRSLLLIGTGSAIVAMGQLAVVLFLTYFLLAAGDLFRRKLVLIVGPPIGRQKTALRILDSIHALNQRYLGVVVLINILVGGCTALALRLVGLEHAGTWGIAMGVLHTIPYVGATLVAVAVALAAYLQFGTVETALLAGALPIGIAAILGIWLQTMLLGRAARMNPPAVFVALLFWGMLWGVWGLLLGVPITMAIKSLCDHIERLKRIGALLAPLNGAA